VGADNCGRTEQRFPVRPNEQAISDAACVCVQLVLANHPHAAYPAHPIGTTANVYAHLDTSDLETAMRRRNRR
jgi:hypothetical protein